MKIMGLYKHINNTDVAILIVKSFYISKSEYYKLKVKWVNIVNPANYFGLGEENLKISREDFKNWKLIG
jgi:hypothetical protein